MLLCSKSLFLWNCTLDMSLFAAFGLSTSARPLSLLHLRKLFSCWRASLTLSKCIHNKKRSAHSQIKDQLECNYNVKFTVNFPRRQFISGHCKHLLMPLPNTETKNQHFHPVLCVNTRKHWRRLRVHTQPWSRVSCGCQIAPLSFSDQTLGLQVTIACLSSEPLKVTVLFDQRELICTCM